MTERNMTEVEKYIKALRKIQKPTSLLLNDLVTWQATAVNLITRIYGSGSNQEKQINNILPFYETEKQANELITSFITDLKDHGLPEKRTVKKDSGINISLNQNVNISLIWGSIKDELTEKQIKEVEEIINGTDNPKTKKEKIFEKMKNFGVDVLSNIMAGILTNPSIYSA